MYGVVVGNNAHLTLYDIWERTRWCSDNNLLHKEKYDREQYLHNAPTDPYVVEYQFHKLQDALLFKLRWGGE